jgi:dihydroorotase
MPNRREFLRTSAALAAAPVRWASAATYDLVIKGGRVVDPSQGLNQQLDIAIISGRIADLRPAIAASDAGSIIDARGRIVTAGLVDLHAHIEDAAMPPGECLASGVTALVDAGSCGADNVEPVVRAAATAPNRVRVLLNLARRGLEGGNELLDFANADVAAARAAFERFPDVLVGIKARLSRTVAGERDIEAIRRAHSVTIPLNLPLMVHVGQTASPLRDILATLRPRDIVTHIYAPPPNGVLDERNRVIPEVFEARKRGVVFDIGNGRNGHITWDVAGRAIDQGFLPDTISSDLTAPGRTDRVFDFPTVLSKFLMLGMTLEQVVACGTVNAARALAPFDELGTLQRGRPADIAVFDLAQGKFEFVDNLRAARVGRQKLIPVAVVSAGKRVR